MKNLLEFILNHLVEHPEDVEVTEESNDLGVLLNVKVNPEDMGRVIGKQGRIIKAIRKIVQVKAAMDNQRVRVELIEDLEPEAQD